MAADLDVDAIIERLLEVTGCRPGKTASLLEEEIRALCINSRFVSLLPAHWLPPEVNTQCGGYCHC